MMSLVSWAKKELARLRIQKSGKLLLPQSSLTTAKSITVPPPALAQEVVLAADLKCAECQRRVSNILSHTDDVESMVFHVFEKKVTLTRKLAQGSL